MTNTELIQEVNRYYSENFDYISSDQPTLSILTNIARHFTDWQKEQMMKEAVEGVVMDFSSNQPRPQVDVYVDPNKYCTGDKVRIIIVKE